MLPAGKPILVEVDPGLDLHELRKAFDFEIVAEQEEGFVLVATADVDLSKFTEMVRAFAVQIRGSATIAQVHKLYDDPGQDDRLRRLLSDRLYSLWPSIQDDEVLVVDIGVACTGTMEIPEPPKRGKRATDAAWASRLAEWALARSEAYEAWDRLSTERQDEVEAFLRGYRADILSIVDGAPAKAAVLPDSLALRIRISGKGFRDFVLNYPFLFEVVEPEDIALPQLVGDEGATPLGAAAPLAPPPTAPAVCVIDSGIQEGHVLLAPAIDTGSSRCFLPGRLVTEVGDYVRPAGHGTRVAGAVLYGEVVAQSGAPELPCWIQNARILDEANRVPESLFPPTTTKALVEHFHLGPRQTRIFNQSINAVGPCRTRHMSAWAAEIDALCEQHDILFVQSSGNVPDSAPPPLPGTKEHLAADRQYPDYLCEDSCRIANPGQSLQALTVGSVAYGAFAYGEWTSFATQRGQPSAFSRSGFGPWDVIKPEVVEFGGDALRTLQHPPDVLVGGRVRGVCPELVRSTMFPPGPAHARDQGGTSYAAPKVARIAAAVQHALPDEPALLHRALVVQSAQWPEWAESRLNELRACDQKKDKAAHKQLLDRVAPVVRWLGFGIPDEQRACTNSEHRTTLVTSGHTRIRAGECHVYQVPIPGVLRRPGDDFEVRVDVTLSYVAQPRRTRRNLRRYLSTWVDWVSNKLGESVDGFQRRVLLGGAATRADAEGQVLPWTLHEQENYGLLRSTRRNSGTVQKDWAVVKSHALPESFCVAVRGHEGWSKDPDSAARYCLAVTLDVQGQEVAIYEELRVAVEELRAEVALGGVDLRVEMEE